MHNHRSCRAGEFLRLNQAVAQSSFQPLPTREQNCVSRSSNGWLPGAYSLVDFLHDLKSVAVVRGLGAHQGG